MFDQCTVNLETESETEYSTSSFGTRRIVGDPHPSFLSAAAPTMALVTEQGRPIRRLLFTLTPLYTPAI